MFLISTLGIPGRRWGNIIKIDLKEIGCESVYWFQLSADGAIWRNLVNAAMNFRVP
jgi:hypothetical protein